MDAFQKMLSEQAESVAASNADREARRLTAESARNRKNALAAQAVDHLLSTAAVPIIARIIEALKIDGQGERVKIDNIEFVITPPVQSGDLKKSIGVGVTSATNPEDSETFLIVHCGLAVSQQGSQTVLRGVCHNSYGTTADPAAVTKWLEAIIGERVAAAYFRA
jgi:hypothetical protein